MNWVPRIFGTIGVVTGLALAAPYAARAHSRDTDTVKGQCRQEAPAPATDTPANGDGTQSEVVVLAYQLTNRLRTLTIASCTGNAVSYRLTLREFRIRSDPDERWGTNLLKMGWDAERTPVGFVQFPGSSRCLYEIKILYDGYSRSERRTIIRDFNICHFASMIIHVDKVQPDAEATPR
jgi:hypothetical protein